MKKKEIISYHEHDTASAENMGFAACATECTGLMPTVPGNEEEENSCRELHSTEIPLRMPSRKQLKDGIYDEKPAELIN